MKYRKSDIGNKYIHELCHKIKYEDPILYNSVWNLIRERNNEIICDVYHNGIKIINNTCRGYVTNITIINRKYNTRIRNLIKYGEENVRNVPKINNMIQNTNLERYGSVSPFGCKKIQRKSKDSLLERYGTEYSLAAAEVREKIIETNMERYGVEYTLSSPDIRERIKSTNVERYGVEYPMQAMEIYNKVQNTNLERYGSVSPFGCKKVTQKAIDTSMERYGVPRPMMLDEVKDRIQNTNMKRYGVPHIMHSPKFRKRIFAKRTSILEKRILKILKDSNILYDHQCIINNCNVSHAFDFGILNDNGNLDTLIDVDGSYFHAYDGDPNGLKIRDDYDKRIQSLIPKGIKYVHIVENTLDEGIGEMFRIINMTYEEYIDDKFNWFKNNIPLPKYPDWLLNNTFKTILEHSIEEYSYKHKYGQKIIKHFHTSMYNDIIINWNNDDWLHNKIINKNIYKDFTDPSRPIHISEFFTASLAKYIITKYIEEDSIIDPDSTYSGRLLGAIGSGKKYYYNSTVPNETQSLVDYFNINESVGNINKKYTYPLFTEVSSDAEIIDIMNNYPNSEKYIFVTRDYKTNQYSDNIIEELNKSIYSEILLLEHPSLV